MTSSNSAPAGHQVHAGLDAIDIHILSILQRDSSLSAVDLAGRVDLSHSPCWRRVQRLKEEGYIKREVAIIDRRKLGLNAEVFASIKLTSHGRAHFAEFVKAIQALPEVIECHVLMGEIDLLLRIVAKDADAYGRFCFEHLSKLPGVDGINSAMALSEVKASTALPLPSPPQQRKCVKERADLAGLSATLSPA